MKFSVFVLFFTFSVLALAKEVADKVVASVDEEIVLLSDMKSMPRRLNMTGSIDEALLLGEPLASLKDDRKQQLNFLIREKLIDSEIKRQNMTVSDEELTAEMSKLARQNQMNDAEFEAYMKTNGYTLDEYKGVLKARKERTAFFSKEIIKKLRITDEDAYGVFQSKFPNYKPSVSEYKIAQIFFAAKTGGATEAQRRARAALQRLQDGESFETLANQIDETPGSNKDGVLGTFRSGEFSPALEKAVENLSINGTSQVVSGSAGYHIVKLLAKTTTLDPNFIRVKEQIKGALVQQNFERQLKNWFELKKSEAHIKIFDEAL